MCLTTLEEDRFSRAKSSTSAAFEGVQGLLEGLSWTISNDAPSLGPGPGALAIADAPRETMPEP